MNDKTFGQTTFSWHYFIQIVINHANQLQEVVLLLQKNRYNSIVIGRFCIVLFFFSTR